MDMPTREIAGLLRRVAWGLLEAADELEAGPGSAEELTTADGRPLGVTPGDLAMQQAIRDFVCGDTDEVPDLDMASTYGGRP